MNLFKSLFAASCVLACCLGNDYPAQAGGRCTALANDLLGKARGQVGMSNRVWQTLRGVDRHILVDRGCDPIGTGYNLRAAEMRLDYTLNRSY